MTSHPATPESETPETDAVWEEVWRDEFTKSLSDTLYDHARSLERRLSLAQTEIKGHMRVEDELKRTLHDFSTKVGDAMLKISHALKADPEKDIFEGAIEAAEKTQARIAEFEKDWETDADYIRMSERIKELEKALAEHGTDAPGGIFG